MRLQGVLVLVRSMLAGGVATLVDLGTLTLLVSVIGVSPRVASLPALLLGGAANFLGNRHFAFRAASGDAKRQAVSFGLVFVVTLALTGFFFDLAMRVGVARVVPYWIVRLIVSNIVYLGWSFPMFRLVFRPSTTASVARALRKS
jgi:putative flippase GtrA